MLESSVNISANQHSDKNIQIDISVFFDPICPWCFIGKRRLDKALAMRPEYSFRLQWHSFQLNPNMPEEGIDRRTYLINKFGSMYGAEEVYSAIIKAGEELQLPFNFKAIIRTPSTLKAHMLMYWLQQNMPDFCDEFAEKLFIHYFAFGEDIGDVKILQKIAENLGHGQQKKKINEKAMPAINDVTLQKRVMEGDMMAHRFGVNGVPFYIIDGDKILSGAQLPHAFIPLFEMAAERQRSEQSASNTDGNANSKNKITKSDNISRAL